MILLDTSLWIEFFRPHTSLDLEKLVDWNSIVVCLPVWQEVLQGFRDERAFRIAHEAMSAFPMVESPLSQDIYEQAVTLYRTARRQGLTVRSSVDCLIAACAIKNDLEVLHKDRDFGVLARISPLRQRNMLAQAKH